MYRQKRHNLTRPGVNPSKDRVCISSSPTLCDRKDGGTSGLPVHHKQPEFTQTHVHWVGDGIQPSQHQSSPSPPALNLSQNQGICKWSAPLRRWPKYWSFRFKIIPSNEHSWLISFRMDLLAVQQTHKSLHQHHSPKASNFSTQLSSQSNAHIHTWLVEKPRFWL